jgi:flagellar hook-associated protein 1 FlgK
MSLTSSLNTAVSGLQANQTLMRVASSNIANANTEGYTKKTGELSAIILGGVGAGVNVDDIRRTVDNFLIKEANNQSSTVAKADAHDRVLFTSARPVWHSGSKQLHCGPAQ